MVGHPGDFVEGAATASDAGVYPTLPLVSALISGRVTPG
jgi:hypothetical protein